MKENKQKNIYDAIIIGSGPAGLTAAIYAARARLEAVVVEKQPMSGGQVLNTYEVDNYPGLGGTDGFELGKKLREHAECAGASFEQGLVVNVSRQDGCYEVTTSQKSYIAKGVIIATGATHRMLGVAGEHELAGRGVSYCATCDGAFFRNKTVAVVGGGDVAVEDAIFLARMCQKVYVVHRRNQLRAAKVLQERLTEAENVEIIWDTIAEHISGTDMVEALHIRNVKTQEASILSLQGVFIAVGIVPNVEGLSFLAAQDENGYFIAGEDCRTSSPRIYAAGDVRTKTLRQIVTATADGANAVASLQEDLL